MKLGVMIEAQEGVGWPEWKNITQWTEELGFESLWRSDHFFSFGAQRATLDALESFAALTYTASHTSRIRFGPLVLSMTFRHPAITARMAAAVDQLSEGRLVLGLGAGWNVPEHEAFGIELPPPGPRLQALEDGVNVIKGLFSGSPATYAGKHYSIKEAPLHPLPAQDPMPILIGGGGEKKTLRIVARHAAEWNSIGLAPERYRLKLDALEKHCEAEQRDPASIDRSMMCSYITAPTEAEVQKKLDEVLERLPNFFRPSREGGLASLPWLIGTPSQIVETLQALEAQGVSRIMLQHREPPAREELEFVAAEILPRA
jgi:F420-dependent oxidoreductase-like protein